MIKIVAPIMPVPFPRPASNAKRRFNPKRYSEFKDKKGYAYNQNYIVDVKISVVRKARRPDNHDSYFFPQGNTLGDFNSVDDARAFIRNFVEKENAL